MNAKTAKKGLGLFLLMLSVALPSFARKTDKYEEWLKKEVRYLITDAERAEFEKLKKDKDKERFIKLFWAKRDPTPRTEQNEFKEEYYRRLEYVEDAFIYGYNRGMDTDKGHVYLSFGKPIRVFNQDETTEIWVYPAQPWMNYARDTFSVVFTRDEFGFALDQTKTDKRVIEALYACPRAYLLYPDLEELPEYRPVISLSPESFEGKLIAQVEEEGKDILNIPFEKKVLFTKAENLSTYATILLRWPESEGLPNKLTVFGRVKSEAYAADFREEKRLIKEGAAWISQVGVPVLPGEYTLFLGMATKDKSSYAMIKEVLVVPNFWTKELSLSSLIASPKVEEARSRGKKGVFDVFSLGRYAMLPFFSQVYTKQDALNVFYYIYNITLDEGRNCSLLIEFELRKGEKTYTLSPQRRQRSIPEGRDILEGTQIPLSALPESGDYELTVRVVDEIAGCSADQKFRFTVR
ncbi:MAG: GWxTD domain-containing protein [Candidatus Aminicenantales bacterium]